jgi:hypothetical protein
LGSEFNNDTDDIKISSSDLTGFMLTCLKGDTAPRAADQQTNIFVDKQ